MESLSSTALARMRVTRIIGNVELVTCELDLHPLEHTKETALCKTLDVQKLQTAPDFLKFEYDVIM